MLGWKSRLDGKDIIPEVELIFEQLHNYATTNQLIICYENKLCKIDRLDYYPSEDGSIVFKNLLNWRQNSYTVAEMLEFLDKYGELIKDIKFEASDGSIQPLVRFEESCDISGVVWYTYIIVGDGNRPFTRIGNPQSTSFNPNVKTIL